MKTAAKAKQISWAFDAKEIGSHCAAAIRSQDGRCWSRLQRLHEL